MRDSETLGKLALALSKAQGEMVNAAKDKDNPFFKSTYADLASVWDACRGPLSKNELAVTQTAEYVDGKYVLSTLLIHSSGEFMESTLPLNPVKNDAQGLGSAITYMRRFSLAALVGVAPADAEDDDGESAVGRGRNKDKLVDFPPIGIIPKGPIHKPQVNKEMAIEISKILASQAAIGISLDDLKAEIYKEFGVNSLKVLSLEQLKKLSGILQETLDVRSKISSEIGTSIEDASPGQFADFR